MNTRRWFLRLLAGSPLLAVLPGPKPGKIRPSSVDVRYPLRSRVHLAWDHDPKAANKRYVRALCELKEMRCRHVLVSNWELD